MCQKRASVACAYCSSATLVIVIHKSISRVLNEIWVLLHLFLWYGIDSCVMVAFVNNGVAIVLSIAVTLSPPWLEVGAKAYVYIAA